MTTETLSPDARQDRDKPEPKYKSFTVRGVKVTVHRRTHEDFEVQRLLALAMSLDQEDMRNHPKKVAEANEFPKAVLKHCWDDVLDQLREKNDGIVPAEELSRIAAETVGKLSPNS